MSMISFEGVDFSYLFSDLNAELLDYFAKENAARANDFSVSSQSVSKGQAERGNSRMSNETIFFSERSIGCKCAHDSPLH